MSNGLLRQRLVRGAWRCLGVAACALGWLPATAAPALPAEAVAQALALLQQAAQALAPAGARVSARAGALDARLRLAPCARVQPFLVAGAPAWGTTRVGLRCAEGPTAWRAFLSAQVEVIAPAWVSKAGLAAGTAWSAEQWEVADTDWASQTAPPLGPSTHLAGRVLARPVAPGQALRETDLRSRRWFSNGQAVRIVASGEGYQINIDGQALGHGMEGQPVRVRTDAGRIVTGVAVGEALVEVRL